MERLGWVCGSGDVLFRVVRALQATVPVWGAHWPASEPAHSEGYESVFDWWWWLGGCVRAAGQWEVLQRNGAPSTHWCAEKALAVHFSICHNINMCIHVDPLSLWYVSCGGESYVAINSAEWQQNNAGQVYTHRQLRWELSGSVINLWIGLDWTELYWTGLTKTPDHWKQYWTCV